MLKVKFGNDPGQHKVPPQLFPKSLPLLVSCTPRITVYIYVIHFLLEMKKHNVKTGLTASNI